MATRTTALLAERFEQFIQWKSGHSRAENTVKAWRQDHAAIAGHLAACLGVDRAELTVADATSEALERAFAAHGLTHRLSSRRRCWSTWNSLCTYLAGESLITENPMLSVSRPRLLDRDHVQARRIREGDLHQLLATLARPDHDGRNPWGERDFAIILTSLATGMRSGELLALSIGDLRGDASGTTAAMRGRASVARTDAVKEPLARVLAAYLRSRAVRFPESAQNRQQAHDDPWSLFPSRSPLFVGHDGRQLTRGTLQYRLKRACQRAGIPEGSGATANWVRRTRADAAAQQAVLGHALSQALRGASQDTACGSTACG